LTLKARFQCFCLKNRSFNSIGRAQIGCVDPAGRRNGRDRCASRCSAHPIGLKIEELENLQAELNANINSAEFYKQSPEAVAACLERLKATDEELSAAYLRWDELEGV
jgi:hypothetical protein